MGVFEGMDPTWKTFEDLDPGDYLFEIAEPGDSGFLREVVDKRDDNAIGTFVSWNLRVLRPEEFANRRHGHMTMLRANQAKLALAKGPYDPAGFTKQFLKEIGVAVDMSGVMQVLDEYITNGEPDPYKMIGVRFWGSIRMGVNPNQPDRVGISKCWPED